MPQIRRVVTGHSADGKAVVVYDESCKEQVSFRKGAEVTNIWSSTGFPIDNSGNFDEAKAIAGTTRDNGTVFRIIEYAPGVTPRNHRTNSLDYAIVLSGQIDMEMDDEIVHLKAGDVLVQRGTIHNWVNRYSVPCVIAFVLIDARPVVIDGRSVPAVDLGSARQQLK
jgi:mannose-6-phosphate isomerase-like protein (cupin superfamily)